MFDVVGKQQLDRCFAEHFAFTLEAVMRSATEYMTFQGHQFQRGRAFVTDHCSLQLLVGIRQGAVEHTFDFGAGEPGSASADCTNRDNDSQEHAC
ncbi:hypothetical protein D3C76_1562950 [compost metagenome]